MGNLMPWEPLREMTSLRDAMNRLFEESFLRPGAFAAPETALATPLDVYETDNSVVLKAAVPGVKPEDLDVTITGDVLTIKGEYKEETQPERKRNYIRQERCYGNFSRTLTLPTAIDANNVSATFENGILTLEMPKKENVKPKSIKINAR
jgi:HSP20 family protein